jgi:hypothetical protein
MTLLKKIEKRKAWSYCLEVVEVFKQIMKNSTFSREKLIHEHFLERFEGFLPPLN